VDRNYFIAQFIYYAQFYSKPNNNLQPKKRKGMNFQHILSRVVEQNDFFNMIFLKAGHPATA